MNNTGSDPHTVSITNVAPTVTFTSGDATVNESDVTLHTYTFTVSDPGDDTVIGNGTTCGVGGVQVGPTTPVLPPPVPMGTTFSFDCRFDDGPKDPDVQANATDSDSATGSFATFPVHVDNVAPVAGNDTGTTDENTNLTVGAPGVLGNDTDVVHDPLTVARVNGAAVSVGTEITLASGAKVTLNADGSYMYKPNGAFEFLDTTESTTDTFTYQAFDGDVLSNTATVTITITGVNDPPVAAATSATVGHLSAAGVDVTLSATDVDGEALMFSIVASPSNGTLGAIGSLTCNGLTPSTCSAIVHYTPNSPSGDFVGTDTFTYQASDGTAASNIATATLTLTNAAPTATVDLTPTAPTTNQTLTATVTPSDADGDALTFTFVWKNGSTVVKTTTATSSTTDTLDLSVAGNGDKGDVITVQVTPKDGHVDGAAATDTETVANSNPAIVSITAVPNPLDEGGGTLVSVSASDADGDALLYEFNCTAESDSTYEFGPQAGMSHLCNYPDGPATHTVGIRVSDGTGSTTGTLANVQVQNVAPHDVTVTPSPSTINENGSITLGGSFIDPGTLDTHSVVISWGDGSTDTTINLAAGVVTFSGVSHQYLDDNPTGTASDSYTIGVTVTDKDAGVGTGTTSVTVNNVAPSGLTANLSDEDINEGDPTTLSGSFTDPGTLDTHTVTIAWGDGSPDAVINLTTGVLTYSAGHTYADDNATDSYTIGVTVTDDDTGSASTTKGIAVHNVAPVLSAVAATSPINENGTSTLTGTITDPGTLDTFTLTVELGRGCRGRLPDCGGRDIVQRQPPVPRRQPDRDRRPTSTPSA